MRPCIFRVVTLLFVPVLLLTLLPACRSSSPPPDAQTILTSMQSIGTWPTGRVYSRSAAPDSADYLSDDLFSALFGPAVRGWLSEDEDGTPPPLSDAALFLSAAPHPAEIAVLRCTDMSAALSAVAICRDRLDLLRRTWADTAYAAWADAGVVTITGNYVLLAVTPEAEEVLRAGVHAVGSRGQRCAEDVPLNRSVVP